VKIAKEVKDVAFDFEPHSALLITDMLNDFVKDDGSLVVPNAKNIVPSIKGYLEAAREQEVPVVHLTDTHREDDKEFKFWPPHAVEDTWGGEVIEELQPLPQEHILRKRRYSAFFGTDLDILLRELRVDKLYLAGVLTNICIYVTAIDAVMHNYQVAVLKDAVASLSEETDRFVFQQLEDIFQIEVV
jgi:nicotinamidase-related amidase